MVTQNDVANPQKEMKSIGITFQLTLKFGHLHYEAVSKQVNNMEIAGYLFSTAELAVFHQNLGQNLLDPCAVHCVVLILLKLVLQI